MRALKASHDVAPRASKGVNIAVLIASPYSLRIHNIFRKVCSLFNVVEGRGKEGVPYTQHP